MSRENLLKGNVLSSLIISLCSRREQSQELTARASQLFHSRIRENIVEIIDYFQGKFPQNEKISRIILDLGDIPFGEFEPEFRRRFNQQFRQQLESYLELPHGERSVHGNQEEATTAVPAATPSSGTPGEAEWFNAYLRYGYWPDPQTWMDAGGVEEWLMAQQTAGPDIWPALIARASLAAPARRRLLHVVRPQALQRLLDAGGAAMPEAQSPDALLLSALHYFQRNLHQDLPLPEVEVLMVSAVGNEAALTRLFGDSAPTSLVPWLKALWRHRPVRRWLESNLSPSRLKSAREVMDGPVIKNQQRVQEEAPNLDFMQVSNAGLVLLWPLLPDLFRQCDLWDKDHFVNPQAQVNAACWLDALIWGEERAQEWRMPFTKRLCGLPVECEIEWQPPGAEIVELQQRWLATLPKQLPGWHTLKTTDMQTLFLQRPGELEDRKTALTLIVKREPFDVLLDDWPWPLDMALLPWMERPLSVQWLSFTNSR